MGMKRWGMLLLTLAAVTVIGTPIAASASCAAPVPLPVAIAAAPTVFVGTVESLSNEGRVATVHVDDVWRGSSLPTVVQVVGTPDLNAAATSVDRTYRSGTQYLFAPTSGGPDRFQDDNCTATQPFAASLSALRPGNAPGPPTASQTPPSEESGQAWVIAVLAVIVLLVVAGAVVLAVWHRRRGFRAHPAA